MNYFFQKIFGIAILMDLQVLGCLEHDLAIIRKCLPVYAKHFSTSITQNLIHRIK